MTTQEKDAIRDEVLKLHNEALALQKHCADLFGTMFRADMFDPAFGIHGLIGSMRGVIQGIEQVKNIT